jgi:hypothetical protein
MSAQNRPEKIPGAVLVLMTSESLIHHPITQTRFVYNGRIA